MKKIAVFNLDVGSAIEYAGDIFVSWLHRLGDVYEYKLQTEAGHTMRWLKQVDPDLIIINEDNHRPFVVAYLYAMAEKYVPIIYIDHVWHRLVSFDADDTEGMWYYKILWKADHVFCLNYKPDYVEWPETIKGKVSNRYYPTDPNVFCEMTPWAEREKNFFYIGNVLPHKLSGDFLAKIRWTDLEIDVYGSNKHATYKRYPLIFDKAVDSGNVHYKGTVPQNEVASVMNEYKYLVMPHHGYEPFNWVLKQCAYCGTIPLITNDRDTHLYDGRWLDWAAGLYMGTKYTSELLENMLKIREEQPDHSKESKMIQELAMDKFNYHEFKNEFQQKVEELLYGETYNVE